MKQIRKAAVCVWMMLFLLMMTQSAAGAIGELSISQMTQDEENVYLYISAADENGEPVTDPPGAQDLLVTSPDASYIPETVEPGAGVEEGISLIYCLDISEGGAGDRLEEIRSLLREHIAEADEKDYAEIILAGDGAQTACRLTGNKEKLMETLDALEVTAEQSQLWDCVEEALQSWGDLGALSRRAAVIIFTEGEIPEESEGEADRLRLLSTQVRIPVFTVALDRDRGEDSFTEIGRFCKHTGGMLFSESESSLEGAFTQILDGIRNAWKVGIRLSPEELGQANVSWNISLADEEGAESPSYVFSLSGIESSSEGPADTESAGSGDAEPPAAPAAQTENGSAGQAQKETETGEKRGLMEQMKEFLTENLFIVIAALMVLIALIILIIVLVKSRKRKNARSSFNDYSYNDPSFSAFPSGGSAAGRGGQGFGQGGSSFGQGNVDSLSDRALGRDSVPYAYSGLEKTIDEFSVDDEKTIDEFSASQNARAAAAQNTGIRVALHISFGGRAETVERVFTDQLVLGRGDKCDVDIVFGMKNDDAKQTSRNHAMLIYRPEGLYIKDNDSRNGTMLNGKEITDQVPIRNEDILQLGKSIVQVRIDRATM